MTFDSFVKNARAIFDSFPNEQVWLQGGLRPNRQLQKPEAGYCIVIRYDEKTTSAISHFMTKIRSVLPPIVEYSEQNLHTTVGTYGKRNMEGFVPDSATLQHLMKSVEKGINNHPQNLRIEFGRWLYNDEAILVSGYPNQDLWYLFQDIENACQENGYPLEMGRIVHITTARFISGVSRQEFEKFILLMKSAPTVTPARPSAIDLATWRCDGLEFNLVTYKRYCL
jgi:2'-5' RNA ligase